MKVEEGETERAEDDGRGRQDDGGGWTEVGGERDSGQDGDRLRHLEEAPCPGKVPGSHLLEDEHLEGVVIGTGGDTGQPDPVLCGGHCEESEARAEAGCLTEILPGVSG